MAVSLLASPSNRAARTAVPPPAPSHRQSLERRLDHLASHRSSRAVTPRRGTVAAGNPRSDMRWLRRGDHSSMERGGGSSSSRRRSLSREPSSAVQERGRGLHRGASPPAAPRVGAEDGSSTRRLGRMDSGLSVNLVPPPLAPRHGCQRGGRGAAATTKLSSSTDAAVTIRSSIRPSSREFMERSPRRAGEAENDRKEVADAARPSRGELSSMERGSSSRRSLSREPSSAVQERGHGPHRGASPPAAMRVGAEGSSTRRIKRLDSRLSASMVSRRGTPRGGRGAATPKLSSSTDAAATTCSRIRPNSDLTERSLRRASEADEDESPRQRRGKGKEKEKADDDAASVSMGRPSRPPRRALNRINSGSTLHLLVGATARQSAVMGATATAGQCAVLGATATATAGQCAVVCATTTAIAGHCAAGVRVSSVRRVEDQLPPSPGEESGAMRRFKEKLGTVFHHLHHHHHFGPSGSNEGAPPLLSRDVHDNGLHRPSPWKVLGGVLHRATRRGEKKTRSVPADRRGGVEHMLLHMWDKRRAMAKQRGDGGGGGVGRALFQMWGKRRAAAKRRGGGVGRALFQMWVKRRATAKRRRRACAVPNVGQTAGDDGEAAWQRRRRRARAVPHVGETAGDRKRWNVGYGKPVEGQEAALVAAGLPGVLFVLPDSYVDAENKDYGAELFVNGEIVQRSPERRRRVEPVPQRAQDRPRYSDRTRYVKRRENQAYQR
ncbi:hypothetical protein OsJ_16042 [Oryza sativa Japonica Group]|uniref:Uncharacterized protein n=1 Tax=Oryza sativa subsp. japonica TaxID=39947 RepID=B9FCB3_ORYSJ|nr:hypothetical protein OsJ_16042 [Oryza sativa Japonica Group]